MISHVKKISEVNPFFTEEMRLAMINAPGPGTVADLVAFALTLPKADAQGFLETLSVKARFEKLLVHLRREQDVADLQKKINEDVNSKINKLQREFFLKEQLKTIKRELGIEEDGKEKTSRTFRERIESRGNARRRRRRSRSRSLTKFETLSENFSRVQRLAQLSRHALTRFPGARRRHDNLDLDHAQEVLDAEHYGLEKVKERIIEFLAVRKLQAGPQGLDHLPGRPSGRRQDLDRQVDRQDVGPEFFPLLAGGMRDEAEIKGHRRTYVGAMPGKVIQGMRRAGTQQLPC